MQSLHLAFLSNAVIAEVNTWQAEPHISRAHALRWGRTQRSRRRSMSTRTLLLMLATSTCR